MSTLYTPDQLGDRWGKTRQALAQMRHRGNGPAYLKVGKSILYRAEDVLAFEESQIRTRTDDEPLEVISNASGY